MCESDISNMHRKISIGVKWSANEDNWWDLLKSWYFNGLGVVKILYIECHKEIGDYGKHGQIFTNIPSFS